jgi:lipoprotein-anchoring transpeptidase ErfK/SrfK
MRPHYDKIRRRPQRYAQLRDDVPVGTGNPLGAQVLCLCRDGSDVYYPVHGELESWAIRRPARNGGIGMLNDRVIRIDERVLFGVQRAVA